MGEEEKNTPVENTTGTDDAKNENVKENVSSSEEGKENQIKDDMSGDDTPPTEDNPKENKSEEKEDSEGEDTPEEKEDVLKDVNPKETTVEQATDILKTKGLDYAALQQEYNETGNISEETRAKLAEVGITSEFVDNFMEGQKARVERALDEISLVVGGREYMNKIVKWASQNISDEEKLSIRNVTDVNIMKSVLKDLKNRMEEKEGKLPEQQLIGEGGKPATDLFESQAQMFEAIRDKRYKTDEAYRNKVLKKIQASRVAGIDLGI